MQRYILSYYFCFLGFVNSSLRGGMRGKVDIGPTLMDIDILESGKTIETLHMKGSRPMLRCLFMKGFTSSLGVFGAADMGSYGLAASLSGIISPSLKNSKFCPMWECLGAIFILDSI